MKKLIVILLLFVVGCSTKQAMERVNKVFVDKNINEIVLKYGFPYNTHQLLNGDLLYLHILSYGWWGLGVIASSTSAIIS